VAGVFFDEICQQQCGVETFMHSIALLRERKREEQGETEKTHTHSERERERDGVRMKTVRRTDRKEAKDAATE